MAQVDKIQVSSTTYNIAPATGATFSATSSDADSATAWTAVDTLASGETTASIFGKISKMFKNIRYLYGQMGTTDISGVGSTVKGAISALNTNKAASSHSHKFGSDIKDSSGNTVSLSNTQVNDNVHVPTSALIYSMNQTLTSLNDAFAASTYNPPAVSRFEDKKIATINSTSTANTFFSTYKASNDWNGLCLGHYITITDGTYNKDWIVADFCSYNAYTGSACIGLIPRNGLVQNYMNSSSTTSGGYMGSYMHTTLIPKIVTALQTVLGTHLLRRRMCISNTVASEKSSASVWVYGYASLMDEVQVFGSSTYENEYDIGEANTKLPLFNFIKPNTNINSDYWLRSVYSSRYFVFVNSRGTVDYGTASVSLWVRPLIYVS